MSAPVDLFWTVEDELFNREYVVRLLYVVDPFDSGDRTTPPAGGGARLEDIQVTQVRHFDDRGNVVGIEIASAAQKYYRRVWKLLEADSSQLQRIEEACSRHVCSTS
jgi:hypothetical protein